MVSTHSNRDIFFVTLKEKEKKRNGFLFHSPEIIAPKLFGLVFQTNH